MKGNTQLVIIILNVNGMKSPIKQKWTAEWIQSQIPTICCLQETHLKMRYTHRVKNGWRRIYFASADAKKKQEQQ